MHIDTPGCHDVNKISHGLMCLPCAYVTMGDVEHVLEVSTPKRVCSAISHAAKVGSLA